MHFDIKLLEFDKIIDQLTLFAHTTEGKNRVALLKPMTEVSVIEKALLETEEAYQYYALDKAPSFGGIHPIKNALERARIQGVLDIQSLLKIHGFIEATHRIKREMVHVPEHLDTEFTLCDYANQLFKHPELRTAIEDIISPQGEIRDDASVTLKKIRQQRITTERRIKDTLNRLLKSEAPKLTETLITLRLNKYVVPVKLSEKNNFKGAIIDYSSSGETVYIEPDVIHDLSVQLNRLDSEETREIEKILYQLSALVANHYETLSSNIATLAHLDFVFAKGKHAYVTESKKPKITGILKLFKARHPLIPNNEVVANTITFDKDVKMMIITGSNTGGKTVTLKTIGLLSMMAQSGLLIPVELNSEIKVFKQIRADIGDEQSIEQSLSTFSSHMTRIVNIITDYGEDCLVLLDELGSGTDPKEGASLAMSILDALSNERNSLVIATTHYPELKAYAYSRDDIMNASVEFDEESLKPTYRLLLRTPGESHAFLISQRLGLPMSIIERAKNNALTQQTQVSQLIQKLKHESHKLDQLIQEHTVLTNTASKELATAKKLKLELQEKTQKYRDQLQRENDVLIKTLKKQAEHIIQELETMKIESFKVHELAEKKHQIKQLVPQKSSQTTSQDYPLQPKDQVYIMPFNRYGEIVKQQKNKQWVVKMGSLTSTFKREELERVEGNKPAEEPYRQKSFDVKKQVSSVIDLRGERVHEAQILLEKYLDDCAVSSMPFATIIHGFGTLAVRKMVHETLKKSSLVSRFRDGESGEGGQGATIVYFD